MDKLTKLPRAMAGMVLMGLNVKKFDTKIFTGKRVAIVGPAGSAYNTGKGDYIDAFDYVIRINKAPKLIAEGRSKQDIGSKTDILFHCFFENTYDGGGALNMKLFDELGIKYVVNPAADLFGLRITLNFYKKYLLSRPIYLLDKSHYKIFYHNGAKFRPTTGFSALNTVLQSDFSECFITGFTFFKTPYADGYRDEMKELDKTKKHIAEAKLHDPDLEYSYFKKMMKGLGHKRILMDPTLEQILQTN